MQPTASRDWRAAWHVFFFRMLEAHGLIRPGKASFMLTRFLGRSGGCYGLEVFVSLIFLFAQTGSEGSYWHLVASGTSGEWTGSFDKCIPDGGGTGSVPEQGRLEKRHDWTDQIASFPSNVDIIVDVGKMGMKVMAELEVRRGRSAVIIIELW